MLYKEAPNNPGNDTLPFPHPVAAPAAASTPSHDPFSSSYRAVSLSPHHILSITLANRQTPSSDQMRPHTSTQTAGSLSSMDNPTLDGQWRPRRLAVPAGSGRAREKESLVPLTKGWPGYLKDPLRPTRHCSGCICLSSL